MLVHSAAAAKEMRYHLAETRVAPSPNDNFMHIERVAFITL